MKYIVPWFYLSFSTDNEWIGACYIQGINLHYAIQSAWQRDINPGGDVLGIQIDSEVLEARVPTNYRNRLLDRAMLSELGEIITLYLDDI